MPNLQSKYIGVLKNVKHFEDIDIKTMIAADGSKTVLSFDLSSFMTQKYLTIALYNPAATWILKPRPM